MEFTIYLFLVTCLHGSLAKLEMVVAVVVVGMRMPILI